MGDRYYSFRPETEPGRLAGYELHFRRGDPDELVGARMDGGLIRFRTAEEGARHVRAIGAAALERAAEMRAELPSRVTAQMIQREALGVPCDAEAIRAELSAVLEQRIASYLADVDGIMAGRETEIGEPDPDLALALLKVTAG